ncbi:hypothetical protein Q3G72_032910 [Acer saccharum]|nr:hypothetical protein Q3G72_032910 [Acer saccharum]
MNHLLDLCFPIFAGLFVNILIHESNFKWGVVVMTQYSYVKINLSQFFLCSFGWWCKPVGKWVGLALKFETHGNMCGLLCLWVADWLGLQLCIMQNQHTATLLGQQR